MSDRRRRVHYAGRKMLWAGIFVLVAAALLAADRLGVFGFVPQSDTEKYDGKTFRVVKVLDGDTLDVNAPDRNYPHTRIRLWGVDTPESLTPDTPAQHFGIEAGEFTRRISLHELVRLELDARETRDRYGRLLAYVYLPDGEMLNRILVAKGYGYADKRFKHAYEKEFRRLQHRARQSRRGLWKDLRPTDLPYYYRDLKLPSGAQE